MNSHIDLDNYSYTWATFMAISLILLYLPPSFQAAVCNISEAYWLIPLHPLQWPGTVLRYSDDDQFLIDISAAFGLAGNISIFGHKGDALADILRFTGILVQKWVDDFLILYILQEHLADYNTQHMARHTIIIANGEQHRTGGRL